MVLALPDTFSLSYTVPSSTARHQIWAAVGFMSVEKSTMKRPAAAAAQVVHLGTRAQKKGVFHVKLPAESLNKGIYVV